ncbi:MAG: CoA pyrophosphatase [Alphaproteobacteria bacterium]|nr:CoA pyrophosphatase [Alphaproteobacteria bacterium]
MSDLKNWLAGRLEQSFGPSILGWDRLAGGAARELRDAAVLVPIIDRAPPTVLLTERAAHLPSHGGQIGFPGGRLGAGDAGHLAAALRESEEEVGLDPRSVAIVGVLDRIATGTGFLIHPFVGVIAADPVLALDASEVADAFEVPLAFLMDPANHQTRKGYPGAPDREFYAMPFEKRFIWGATAAILKNLSDRVGIPATAVPEAGP